MLSTQYSVLSSRCPALAPQPSAVRCPVFIFHFSFFIFQSLGSSSCWPSFRHWCCYWFRSRKTRRLARFFAAGSWTLLTLWRLSIGSFAGARPARPSRAGAAICSAWLCATPRNPGRSALAVALTAAACFLIAAVSVFRVDPAKEVADRHSGSGGFKLIGQSAVPVYYDLNTADGRKELGASRDDAGMLAECRFYAFRVKPGDDASCLNLYRPQQPRMLGAGADFIARDSFSWADPPAGPANPWEVLKVGWTSKSVQELNDGLGGPSHSGGTPAPRL